MQEETDVFDGGDPAMATSNDPDVPLLNVVSSPEAIDRGGIGNLGSLGASLPEAEDQSAGMASVLSEPAVDSPISEDHHEHCCDHSDRPGKSGTVALDNGPGNSMASGMEPKDKSEYLPRDMSHEVQVCKESGRGGLQVDRALVEAVHGEDDQAGIGGSANVKDANDAADTSDAKDDVAMRDTSRVGFKHDPDEEEVLAGVELDVGTAKKRKNRRRPKSKRGVNAPTGFEPFYADAPMTPQEFEENEKLYDPALPITTRLEEAIMRFLYKRLLSPYRRKVFLKFLQYGRINVGQRHSQGVTPSELKEMTKDEAMEARSMTAIFPENLKGCRVAFNRVTTGYLSGYYMGHYNPDTEEEIRECTETIKNYFTYLLYHNVCPEYKDDLEEGRKTCDRAAKELWMNQQLVHHDGPGSFNRGCSMLFGGHYFEAGGDSDKWKTVLHADQETFTTDTARKVVKYAIAIAGDDLTAQKFKILADRNGITAKQIEDIDGFEIISVEHPSAEIIALYRELSPDLVPVGKVVAKEFRDPSRGTFDLTPWEKVDWDAGLAPTYKFEFFLEAPMLVHILPGMKFITTVYVTNFGQYFFDEILDVLPTFYTFLYNDWLMDHKEPKALNFIPDEDEITRRRAQASILRPADPSVAEITLKMMTQDLVLQPEPGESSLDFACKIVRILEDVGWDLQEIKEMVGLVKPQTGKEELTKEDMSTQENKSAKEDKGKQAVRDVPDIEQPVAETRVVHLDTFYEPDPTKPLTRKMINDLRQERMEKLAKQGKLPKQIMGTEKEHLDRVIKDLHNPEKIKVTLSPEYKEAFRKYQLKLELQEAEMLKQKLKDLELREQQIRHQLGLGSTSQGTEISDEQVIPKSSELHE